MTAAYSRLGRDDLAVLFGVGAIGTLSDAELLARFARDRGDSAAEAAFAALVDRHGPMVLGVCRRVAGDPHAADDAFQAVFLVLARKARSLRVGADDSIGRWLYGVSLRVARRARTAAGRRSLGARDFDGLDPIDPSTALGPCERADLRDAIDAEIARLPARYRSVVVLCYLEGLSREQAARRLRCPVGTVESRLHRARERLRSGLTRRGLAPAVGAMVGALERTSRAAVPSDMAKGTAAAAARIAAGEALAGAPAAVAELARLQLREMAMRSCWLIAGLAALGIATTGGVAGLATVGGDQPKPAPSARPVPAAEAAPVHAYDLPVPASAKFQTATIVVLDDETSQPLAGAAVMLLNYVDLIYYTFPTDPGGRLRFEYPYTGARPVLNLEVRKDGYVPLQQGWGHDGGSDPPKEALTLRLRRGTTMGGIVVHEADRPVEGVTVVMTVTRYGPGRRAANPTGQEFYCEIPSRTGPDGRWRTDSVPPDAEEVNLQLIHPDFVCDGSTTLGWSGRSAKVAALRDRSDRQVLLRGAKIVGRVLDDRGRPIAGARVVDSTRGLTFLEYVWRTDTDAEGRFHIHLPRGKDVSLTVQAQGYQPTTRDVAATPDDRTVEFRLAPGRLLRGRIVDPRGKPIMGAQLIIPSYSKHKGIFFRKWTDTQGRFEWDSAPAESVVFMIGAEGYVSMDPVSLTASDKETVIVLQPGVAVSLRVVDADSGQPIPRFGVQIGRRGTDERDFRWGERTAGRFEGDYRTSLEAEGGLYQIRVFADGYATAQTRTFGGEEKAIREVIRLEKERE